MKRIPFASAAAPSENAALWGGMHCRTLLAAFVGLAITAGAAHATVFTGTDAFTDSTPHNPLNLTATYDLNPMSFNLTAGHTFHTSDLLTIRSTDNSSGGTATDNIEVSFTFTDPSSGTGSTSGSGSETVYSFWGWVYGSTGAITWDNPSTINFADGAILNVSLGNATLSGSGTTKTAVISASFTDVQDPTDVPEPMSLAALGSGLIGLGMVRRKRA